MVKKGKPLTDAERRNMIEPFFVRDDKAYRIDDLPDDYPGAFETPYYLTIPEVCTDYYRVALQWFVFGYEAAENNNGRACKKLFRNNKLDKKLLKDYIVLWEFEFKKVWQYWNTARGN